MCKTKKNSSLYCPVNPCLSVHIQVQGQGETSLAVGQSNVHFAFQPQIFSKLNTETFTYWHSVILGGSKGTVLSQLPLTCCLPHTVILLGLLLRHPRLAVLGIVRLHRPLIFTCALTEAFFRRMKSKFTWLFMA